MQQINTKNRFACNLEHQISGLKCAPIEGKFLRFSDMSNNMKIKLDETRGEFLNFMQALENQKESRLAQVLTKRKEKIEIKSKSVEALEMVVKSRLLSLFVCFLIDL